MLNRSCLNLIFFFSMYTCCIGCVFVTTCTCFGSICPCCMETFAFDLGIVIFSVILHFSYPSQIKQSFNSEILFNFFIHKNYNSLLNNVQHIYRFASGTLTDSILLNIPFRNFSLWHWYVYVSPEFQNVLSSSPILDTCPVISITDP